MTHEERKVWIREYLRARRARARETGLCVDCQRLPVVTKALCVECLPKHRQRARRYYRKKRGDMPVRIKKPSRAELRAAKEFEAAARVERMLNLAAITGDRATI